MIDQGIVLIVYTVILAHAVIKFNRCYFYPTYFKLFDVKHWNLLFLYVYFYLCFTARRDYFTHFELSQSLDGAKTGDPREKPPDHLKQNWACLTCDPTEAQTHRVEMTGGLVEFMSNIRYSTHNLHCN